MTLISPGDCTLQSGMWLWNRDIEFARWQHPAVWQLVWDDMPLNSPKRPPFWNSTLWFRFHRNFIEIGPPSAEKNDVMSIFKMAYLSRLGFYGFFEKPNYILVNCLVFQKIAFLNFGVNIQGGRSPPSWILGVP